MYNEFAVKRDRLLKKSYEHLKEAREYIYDALYDEVDQVKTLTMEQWADQIGEVLDELLPSVIEPEDEAEIADEFLYGG